MSSGRIVRYSSKAFPLLFFPNFLISCFFVVVVVVVVVVIAWLMFSCRGDFLFLCMYIAYVWLHGFAKECENEADKMRWDMMEWKEKTD